MDMKKLKKLWDLCGMQLLLILFGAILLLFPDSAVALVTKLIAWILVLVGGVMIFKSLSRHEDVKKWIMPALGALAGGYMLANPLVVSNLIGRILGVLLIIQGMNDLRKSRYQSAKVLGGLTFGAGLVLMLIPRALVNTLLALVGLVLIVIGVINCADKLRHGGRLEEGSDPNIIDAEP